MVEFSVPLNDPNPDFKNTPLFDVEYLRNGTRETFYNARLIETYAHTQRCYLE